MTNFVLLAFLLVSLSVVVIKIGQDLIFQSRRIGRLGALTGHGKSALIHEFLPLPFGGMEKIRDLWPALVHRLNRREAGKGTRKRGKSLLLWAAVLIGLLAIWRNVFVALCFTFVGFIFKSIISETLEMKRQEMLREEIRNFLEVLETGFRAGLSISQVLTLAGQEVRGLLGEELKRSSENLLLGLSPLDVLRGIDSRLRNKEFSLIYLILKLQRKTGANTVRLLREVSESVRRRNQLKREIDILTAQGRLSGLMVSLLPFGYLIILFLASGPSFRAALDTPLGMILASLGLVLDLAGFLTIRRIMRIEVG